MRVVSQDKLFTLPLQYGTGQEHRFDRLDTGEYAHRRKELDFYLLKEELPEHAPLFTEDDYVDSLSEVVKVTNPEFLAVEILDVMEECEVPSTPDAHGQNSKIGCLNCGTSSGLKRIGWTALYAATA